MKKKTGKGFEPKRIVALFMTILLAVSLAGCGSMIKAQAAEDASSVSEAEPSEENTQESAQVIKVGFVYPKTGVYASFGEYTEEFTNYAVDKANAAGIQINGGNAKISLITADSQSDPREAEAAALRLIEEKNVDIMITSKTADTTVPVSKICEKKGVVCLSVDTPDEAWAVRKHKYSFHAGFNTKSELDCFKAAWDQSGSSGRIGVMHANDTEGSIMINAMPEYAEANGYTAYDPGPYQPGQTDFSNVIRNLKTQKVDILSGVMTTEEFNNFYQQLEEDGYLSEIKCITIAKAALFERDIENLDVNGLCTEVWWNEAFPFVSSMDGMTGEELAEQFETVTGKTMIPATAGYDYANIEILYAVLNAAGSLDTAALVAAAKGLEIDTVIGPIRYNEQNYSEQPLATGQWIYDNASLSWKLEIINTEQIEGMEKTGDIQAL